ncbi:MAG TPA: hypothetical protein VK147_10285, partial [Candidatus Didemnitutus sp.]|nr:hypothetical protein [Candidatus Didemnitutus sp.]
RHPITTMPGWGNYRSLLFLRAVKEFTNSRYREHYPCDQLYVQELRLYVADRVESLTGHRPRVSKRDLIEAGLKEF